jgi:N4-gp56 family major capsid protein|nr:MAG TPA_asm: major capsid protein [Caudoviricetes sp.]
MPMTKLANLVDPEVMADMVSATLPKKIKFTPIAHIDTTLVGQPGDTITVPKYAYIGDAEDVAEGVAMGTTVLTASTTKATVKKAGKGVEITDESVLSGYGDPLGNATDQLAKSLAAKMDNDGYAALCTATLVYDGTEKVIAYNGIVDADAKFGDESDDALEKILFIHPDQEATLRKDADFMDKNKYPLDVVMNGTIGKIAGCQVVKSKKVKVVKYEKDNESGTVTIVKDETAETGTNKHLGTIAANCIDKLAVGDKVKAVDMEFYACPIVVVDTEDPNEDPDADGVDVSEAALTYYMKRDIIIENDRDILAKTTVITADEHYTAVLSNESKVVLAKFKA